ncbi:MAG: hypothetical protein ABI353_10260 [Isosphaeraceae bacterium]
MGSEVELRSPSFLGGLPIVLGDGQEWAFPGPRELFDVNGQFNSELLSLLEAIREVQDESERLRGELALAIQLLSLNYELRPDDFTRLLGGPDVGGMQRGFHDLATRLFMALADREQPQPVPETGRRFRLPSFRSRVGHKLACRSERVAS